MTPDDQRRARKVARAKITRSVNERGFSAAEERWLDLITEGVPPLDAAKQAGISKRSAGLRMVTPGFLTEVNRRVGAIRTAEGPRSLLVARTIRDRGLEPNATAAQQRVAIDAAKFIEGETVRPGAVVNIGLKIGPGLVVDLSDDPDPPMRDVTPPQRAILTSAPTHLRGPVDMGEEPAEVAEVRQEPTPGPLVPCASEPGFRGPVLNRSGSKPVKLTPYCIPRRG